MVAVLADRPSVARADASTIESVVVLAELGRCDSCRHVDVALVAVTFVDGTRFEVGACCTP